MRITHTYAVLEVSASAYSEIRRKLLAAGYPAETEIDMHGIALINGGEVPIPMVLCCPSCGLRHVDVDDETGNWASSRIHMKHLCKINDGGCGHIWKAANVFTVGVAQLLDDKGGDQ